MTEMTNQHYALLRDRPKGPWPKKLPEYVKKCYFCDGLGERQQTYTIGCDMGSHTMMGRCDHCGGLGLRMQDGGLPTISVLNQILVEESRS
jgi:hypothetical protein